MPNLMFGVDFGYLEEMVRYRELRSYPSANG
jgi:hypothetical protein